MIHCLAVVFFYFVYKERLAIWDSYTYGHSGNKLGLLLLHPQLLPDLRIKDNICNKNKTIHYNHTILDNKHIVHKQDHHYHCKSHCYSSK